MSQSGSLSGGTSGLTIPVTVPNGGTGQVTLPIHSVLIGQGTSAIGNAGPGAANSILMGQGAGADPIFGTLIAGSNITLTPGASSITISSSGGGGAGNVVFTGDAASTATTNAGAINIFGDLATGSSVLGDGAQTITVANLAATTAQKGVVQLATNAQAIAGSDTAAAVTSDDLKAKLGTQATNGIAFGNGQSSALGWTAQGGANTVLLGNGGVPTFGAVPNAALTNSTVTLSSGNNITVTGGGPLALGGVASFNVTGTTNHAVLLGNASTSINSAALGTNGQVLIGSTGADPQFGSITSGDGSITITGGAGTLALSVTSGTTVGKTITGDTGGALSPTLGNWNILGTSLQGLSFSGLGSTLTGTIANATTAQKGVAELASNAETLAGTDTERIVTPDDLKAKLGVQTLNGIAFGAGTAAALSWTNSANYGVLISSGAGVPSFLANGTSGQVLLATTGSTPSWGTAPASAGTITGDSGGALSQTASNWNVIGHQAGTVAVMDTIGATSTLKIEDRTWLSQFIVDPSSTAGLRGTYTTITSAIADAVSGQSIFVRPGTYTENFSAKDGVTIWGGDGFQDRVSIVGKITLTSGICNITNIKLQTNSDSACAVSGGTLVLRRCQIIAANSTALVTTSTGAIACHGCDGNISTSGLKFFDFASSGASSFFYCRWSNSGASTTASTLSGGNLDIRHSDFDSPITTSGVTAILGARHSSFGNIQNVTALTAGSTAANNNCTHCNFFSGTASAISISTGATLEVTCATIQSTNANAITGSGTIKYSGLTFTDTGSTMNVTTQTVRGSGPRILVGSGPQILSGSGDPDGVVTAPKGSLFLRTDGTGSTSRAYINKDSSTDWTAIDTGS